MRKLDYAPALIFSQGGFDDDPKFYEAVGDDANYGSKRQLWSPVLSSTKPILKTINDEFKRRHGRDMNDNSVRYITMIQVLADAINRARSADSAAILAKAMVAQILDRQPKIVFPPEAAVAKPVWPIPAWNRR